ncbi:MAG: flagellar FlbD family protein [Planctomycetes bacterium]|nr:flagellar FlbD family protein [Planctomycetota bacterium]
MIRMTRLNDRPFVLNAELIKFIEETPDTVITLVTNERVIVRESAEEVVRRAVAYGREIRTFRVDG